MKTNYSLSQKEIQDLLSTQGKQSYKMIGHSFTKNHGGKPCCPRCGLLALRNRATEWCIDKGCNYEDHPQYESAMKRLTKQK